MRNKRVPQVTFESALSCDFSPNVVSHLGYTSPRLPCLKRGCWASPSSSASGSWLVFCWLSRPWDCAHNHKSWYKTRGGTPQRWEEEGNNDCSSGHSVRSAAADCESVPWRSLTAVFALSCSTTRCGSTKYTNRPAGPSCWRRSIAQRKKCSSLLRYRHVLEPSCKTCSLKRQAQVRTRLGQSPGQELCLDWGSALGVRNNQEHPSAKAIRLNSSTNAIIYTIMEIFTNTLCTQTVTVISVLV